MNAVRLPYGHSLFPLCNEMLSATLLSIGPL
jgi:hypothetical protein